MTGAVGSDAARALEALRWQWGDGYDIGLDGGQWRYRRRDGLGGRETADDPGELGAAIADDCAFRRVRRVPS
ncbi:MAG TPA: hypothetical protein VKV35_02465 [Streptosporangiaceae bacterium]|jgi:hypothetical protein|nr:hypothetical protein [Streptosporangiaceae bacterium]